MKRLALLLAAGLACTAPARANDTTAQLGTGGLVFVRNEHVELKAEDLFVSPERIRVTYRFHNNSDQRQRVMVAFPLPDITGNPYTITGIPDGPPDNIFGFETTFDGKPVEATLHQYAFVSNIDHSAELRELGIPLAPFGNATVNALQALPEEQKARLDALGLVSRDDFRNGNGAESDMTPIWTLRSAYSWNADFPAGRDVEVVHSYKPSVGGTVATTFLAVGNDGSVTPAQPYFDAYKARYCVDDTLLAALRKSVVSRDDYRYVPFTEQWISYIWSTGANWAGPIGRFTLTVDKGDPKSLVSFCGEGVKKTGPTTFRFTATDWMPGEKELEILLLNRLDPPQ